MAWCRRCHEDLSRFLSPSLHTQGEDAIHTWWGGRRCSFDSSFASHAEGRNWFKSQCMVSHSEICHVIFGGGPGSSGFQLLLLRVGAGHGGRDWRHRRWAACPIGDLWLRTTDRDTDVRDSGVLFPLVGEFCVAIYNLDHDTVSHRHEPIVLL